MPGTTFAEIVRENVRGLRSRRGLSQSQLAERMKALGFPWYPSTVNSLEQKKRNVHVAELGGLAHSLEVDVADLLDPSGCGQHADVDLGPVPALPNAYARSLVRADAQRTCDPAKIIRWREQDGKQVPCGWWTAEPDKETLQAVGDVMVHLRDALGWLGWQNDWDRDRFVQFIGQAVTHEVGMRRTQEDERAEAEWRVQEDEAVERLRRAEEEERAVSSMRSAVANKLERVTGGEEADGDEDKWRLLEEEAAERLRRAEEARTREAEGLETLRRSHEAERAKRKHQEGE